MKAKRMLAKRCFDFQAVVLAKVEEVVQSLATFYESQNSKHQS
jgi:hypothetical protein